MKMKEAEDYRLVAVGGMRMRGWRRRVRD